MAEEAPWMSWVIKLIIGIAILLLLLVIMSNVLGRSGSDFNWFLGLIPGIR